MITFRDDDLKFLEDKLDKMQLQEQQKAELLESMRLRFGSEQRVLTAILDIGSKDPLIREKAATELLNIRDARTIPVLVQTMEEEGMGLTTPTKFIVRKALIAFGEKAVLPLIEEVREHARLVSEGGSLSDDPQFEVWRSAVLDSDAGKLLVRIGSASIPSLKELRTNEGLLGEAADALLSAIEKKR